MKDASGGVLPGVVVSLKHVGTGRVFESTTSAEGGDLVPLLPIGNYEATFTLSGFQTRTVRGITLNVNDRIQVDATMATGGVAEVVEVTGQTLVQTTTAVQNLIDSRQVQELPINNRHFAKLVELAPGVSSDFADEVSLGLTSNTSISVNGTRRNAVNWLVDGVMNVDVGSNITLLSTPTLESIEQFKIIASGGGHVRQLRTRAVPPAGTPPVGPELLEELLSDEHRADAVQGGVDQRVRSAPVAGGSGGPRPRQHVHLLGHDVQCRGRSLRANHCHPRRPRNSARPEVVLVVNARIAPSDSCTTSRIRRAAASAAVRTNANMAGSPSAAADVTYVP
ncbi:MAG: carboxypeptidase-like regulatory domain-containing protein [Cyanobacteria bacterium]|nr:carboxypeptidase-like regulatory domain-containing protein [Cyanobacteriota bacterium]